MTAIYIVGDAIIPLDGDEFWINQPIYQCFPRAEIRSVTLSPNGPELRIILESGPIDTDFLPRLDGDPPLQDLMNDLSFHDVDVDVTWRWSLIQLTDPPIKDIQWTRTEGRPTRQVP